MYFLANGCFVWLNVLHLRRNKTAWKTWAAADRSSASCSSSHFFGEILLKTKPLNQGRCRSSCFPFLLDTCLCMFTRYQYHAQAVMNQLKLDSRHRPNATAHLSYCGIRADDSRFSHKSTFYTSACQSGKKMQKKANLSDWQRLTFDGENIFHEFPIMW